MGDELLCEVMGEDTLLKVTFEYADRTETLEGDEVQRWLKAGSANATLAWAHGCNAYDNADLHWKVIPK